MPFTPFHMGPGMLMKALFQGSFSLIVFGWTQFVMDIQPLLVLMSGEGHLHGFTHTYVGAALIAVFSAATGKYIGEGILRLLTKDASLSISWSVALFSAFIGSYSHVVLDAVMHRDVEPYFPFTPANPMLGAISVIQLHKLCLYSGLAGMALYFVVRTAQKRRKAG